MSKSLNVALMAMMSGASCENVTEVPTEVAQAVEEVKQEVDWTCRDFLTIASTGQDVVAVHDCRTNIDVTRQVRGVDPSLAEGALNVVYYNPAEDRLLVFNEKNDAWAITGISDVVLEIPNATVQGERIKF